MHIIGLPKSKAGEPEVPSNYYSSMKVRCDPAPPKSTTKQSNIIQYIFKYVKIHEANGMRRV